MNKEREALKLALECVEAWDRGCDRDPYWRDIEAAVTAIKEALAEQPAQQEPVAAECKFDREEKWVRCEIAHHNLVQSEPEKWPGYQTRLLYTSPPASKPLFKEFIKWAGAQGYDCAQTCNSDTGEWICLNPMTADLWKAWQAAHGITGEQS